MSTNKTTHYQLNQWEPEDKVLRTEFNEDNLKLDAALDRIEAAALRIASGSYTGDGQYGYAQPRTLDFSTSLGRAPALFIIQEGAGDGSDAVVLFYGMTRGNRFTWSGTTLTWYGDTPNGAFNSKNAVYRYWAIG